MTLQVALKKDEGKQRVSSVLGRPILLWPAC